VLVTTTAGLVRALGGDCRDYYSATLAAGVLLILTIALCNSWQLVISHEPDPRLMTYSSGRSPDVDRRMTTRATAVVRVGAWQLESIVSPAARKTGARPTRT
jgi:hypothetical protein